MKFNYALYYSPTFKSNDVSSQKYNQDVYFQLQHLKIQLDNGAGETMQSIYPEGIIFINVLYGLSWINLISNQPKDSKIYEEGIKEVSKTLDVLKSKNAKQIFTKDLPLEYGAFYRGWYNCLLGNKLKIQLEADRNSLEVMEFRQTCSEINQVLEEQASPYIESYHNSKWPADGIVAVYSLQLHDEIFSANKYKETLKKWISNIKDKLDSKTGLIPHSVNASNDSVLEGARGSSQSLILNFIKDIDEEFAQDQFNKYKKLFLTSRLGMPGIREYPIGSTGRGDIDSGPVIWDVGGAASIVGQRAMGMHQDWSTYLGLRNSIESFGCSITINSKKKYLFGILPMADAFIVWSNSIEQSKITTKERPWRLKIQILSLLLMSILAWIVYKI